MPPRPRRRPLSARPVTPEPPPSPGGVAVRWDHAAGRPVRVLSAGTARADADDVVIVPGLGAIGYLLPFVRALGGRRRVQLLDVPGFGHRATARSPSALDDVRGVVAAWLAARSAQRLVVMGHSTGAQVALRAVADAPAAVAALVLVGPTFPPEARTWRGLVRGAARTLPHESPRMVPAAGGDYLRAGRRVLTLLRTAMADRPEDVAADLSVPLVVVRGEHDAVCPQPWAERLAAAAPDGRAITWPGAHNVLFQSPGAAADALCAALGRHP